jgi:hypothetical protein
MSQQEIKALLERTGELLSFVDYELSMWREDLAWRAIQRKDEQEHKQLVVQPALRLPSKAR